MSGDETNTQVENNVVYSTRRVAPDTVTGIVVENYSGGLPCTGITVVGNRIRWTNSGGASPIWADGGCLTASDRKSRRNDRTLDASTLLDAFRRSDGFAEAAADPTTPGGW